MINLNEFTKALTNNFQVITGVPCSYFKEFLAYLSSHDSLPLRHILSTREDEAIGIAYGVGFSGKKALIYMQNSGLGNIGDALTSLAQLYKLPMLLLISYRGLESDRDFPEHSIMGQINETVLEAYQIPYWILREELWQKTLQQAILTMHKTSRPVALLVNKGVLSS